MAASGRAAAQAAVVQAIRLLGLHELASGLYRFSRQAALFVNGVQLNNTSCNGPLFVRSFVGALETGLPAPYLPPRLVCSRLGPGFRRLVAFAASEH